LCRFCVTQVIDFCLVNFVSGAMLCSGFFVLRFLPVGSSALPRSVLPLMLVLSIERLLSIKPRAGTHLSIAMTLVLRRDGWRRVQFYQRKSRADVCIWLVRALWEVSLVGWLRGWLRLRSLGLPKADIGGR
jgi:hypothetical protein